VLIRVSSNNKIIFLFKDVLADSIYENYWVLYSIQEEMSYYFGPEISAFNNLFGTMNNEIKDIQAAILTANKTNLIWAANFKIMDNAFDQLKKKLNSKS